MSYLIRIYPEAQAAIEALPGRGLQVLADAFEILELTPWAGRSVNHAANPDAPLRHLPFSAGGLVTYLVLDRDQEVHVVSVLWVG